MPPATYRPDWEETWLSLASLMALRSKCPVQVGAVIVDRQQRVVSTGYAGPPALWTPGFMFDVKPGAALCTKYCVRANADPAVRDPGYGDCPTSHAEANALMFADRSRAEEGSIYVSSIPCFACVKMIANSGVGRCVWIDDEAPGREPEKVMKFLWESRVNAYAVRPEKLAVKIAAPSEDPVDISDS